MEIDFRDLSHRELTEIILKCPAATTDLILSELKILSRQWFKTENWSGSFCILGTSHCTVVNGDAGNDLIHIITCADLPEYANVTELVRKELQEGTVTLYTELDSRDSGIISKTIHSGDLSNHTPAVKPEFEDHFTYPGPGNPSTDLFIWGWGSMLICASEHTYPSENATVINILKITG